MSASVKYLPAFFMIATALSAPAVAQVRVFAQVDTSKDIYVGERFAYNIIIDGDTNPGQVDLNLLAKYKPQSTGNRPVSQSSVSIINGKMTQKVVKQCVMGFSLVADAPGRIQLPSLTVTFAGKTYRTNPIEVNILQPGTTDRLDLEAALSEKQCYAGQPVVMTVKFYISADIGDFQFNIPVLTNNELFYFENPDIIHPRAKQYRLSTAIPEPVYVTKSNVAHKGKNATLLSFSKVLLPKRPGKVQIQPASVSADVAVSRSRSFFGPRYQYKRFVVSSQTLNLIVLPLPDENKPLEFYGLVGRYTISASATPTKVSVGDPITLTIKIGGSKFLKPVQWPDLEQLPRMSENFKIPSQRSSPTIANGFKVFTQTIRANNDKVSAIPPILLVFFDPDKGKYVTARTSPIKLEVAPTKILTTADLEGTQFARVNKEVEAIKKGLSANYEGPEVLINQSFSPLAAMLSPGYASLWALPLGLLVVSTFIKLSARTNPERVALRRRRSACARAVKQLRRVASADSRQRHESLASIMRQYVGDRFDRVSGSLTADDCHHAVLHAAKDTELAEKCRRTIAACEEARYASAETDVDATQIKEAIQLIHRIDKKSKK